MTLKHCLLAGLAAALMIGTAARAEDGNVYDGLYQGHVRVDDTDCKDDAWAFAVRVENGRVGLQSGSGTVSSDGRVAFSCTNEFGETLVFSGHVAGGRMQGSVHVRPLASICALAFSLQREPAGRGRSAPAAGVAPPPCLQSWHVVRDRRGPQR